MIYNKVLRRITDKQFVTIKDLENFTLNHKGHKEDIISTIELTLDTFV